MKHIKHQSRRTRRQFAAEDRRIGRENNTPCDECGGPPEVHDGMDQYHSYRPEAT